MPEILHVGLLFFSSSMPISCPFLCLLWQDLSCHLSACSPPPLTEMLVAWLGTQTGEKTFLFENRLSLGCSAVSELLHLLTVRGIKF